MLCGSGLLMLMLLLLLLLLFKLLPTYHCCLFPSCPVCVQRAQAHKPNQKKQTGLGQARAEMEATFEYLVDDPRWENEKPYKLYVKTDSTVPLTNCQFESGKAPVQDVRQLDKHMQHSFEMDGFELVHSPLPGLNAADFEDPKKDESVAVPYLQTTMNFLKNRLSAEHIVCIDWRVRAGHLVHFSSIPVPRANRGRADSNRYPFSSELKGERKRTFETSVIWRMYATKLCSLRDMSTPVRAICTMVPRRFYV